MHLPLLRIAVLTAVLPVAGPAPAQDTGAPTADPRLVLTRTVHPRTAYRGLDAQDNPEAATATTFPRQVFHTVLEGATGEQLTDGALGEYASLPTLSRTLRNATTTGPGAAEAAGRISGSMTRAPLGPGATLGGAVSGVTAGLGALIGQAVQQSRTGGGP